MHLYLLTRGIKKDVDDFITQLQGKYLPMLTKINNGIIEDTKPKVRLSQVAVRPIQLWEIVFPAEHRDVMLRTCLGDVAKGVTHQKKHRKFVVALRKILGIKKIPDYPTGKNLPKMPISRENMEVVGVGIKEDYYKDGVEML